MTIHGNPADALKAAVKAIGGQAPTARLLGVSQPTVWEWVNKSKPLPASHVLKVEASTGVSRHDLRPDLYPRDAAPSPADAIDDQLEPVR